MDNKMQFIFVGRLGVEKGFDLVLQLIQDLEGSELKDRVFVHIFGDGPLRDDIGKYDFVQYYGFQAKEKVFETWESCHYSLMPSKFLETFGLSALDSLSLGVPVVGYQKGGLEQFGEGIIHIPEGEDLFPHIQTLTKKHEQTEYDTLSKKCKTIASQYTRDIWKEQFESYLGRPIQGSKILLISDYLNNIGGIESYLETITEKLKGFGAKARRVGINIPNKKWLRYLLMPLSLHNVVIKNQLKKVIKNDTYDVIRRHSIQRNIGPAPIQFVGNNTNTKQWLMIHDFGLIHPFPSQIHSEAQFIDASDISPWIEAGFERFGDNVFQKILRSVPLFLKWWSSRVLKKVVGKHIDTILVPSEYMAPIIKDTIGGEVGVLHHAI